MIATANAISDSMKKLYNRSLLAGSFFKINRGKINKNKSSSSLTDGKPGSDDKDGRTIVKKIAAPAIWTSLIFSSVRAITHIEIEIKSTTKRSSGCSRAKIIAIKSTKAAVIHR